MSLQMENTSDYYYSNGENEGVHFDNNRNSEHVEWDMPLTTSNNDSNEKIWLDMSKLSLNTGMRDKLWEDDQKQVSSTQNEIGRSSSNHCSNMIYQTNFTQQDKTVLSQNNMKYSSDYIVASNDTITTYFDMETFNRVYNADLSDAFPVNNDSSTTSTSAPNLGNMILENQQFSHLNRMMNGLPSFKEVESINSEQSVSARLLSDKEDLKHEIEELKTVISQLHAIHNGESKQDIQSSTLPIQLAFNVLKLQTELQGAENVSQNQSEQIKNLENEASYTLSKHEQEIQKLNNEIDDLKSTNSLKENGKSVGDTRNEENTTKLKSKLKSLERDQKLETKSMKHQISMKDEEIEHYKNSINDLMNNNEKRRKSIENVLSIARFAVDKGRQEKYQLLVEKNKLNSKLEKVTDALKSYQMRNDDMSQHHNNLEQEVDRFHKLQSLIQEHGLPNHDQLIVMQQQAESFKEDIIGERKEKERALAQREKLRRDFEAAQARVSSLQEQVCKYQEHIMKLNLEKRNYQGQLETLTGIKQVDKFSNDGFSDAFIESLSNPDMQPPLPDMIERRDERQNSIPRRHASDSKMIQGPASMISRSPSSSGHFNPRFERQQSFNGNKSIPERNFLRPAQAPQQQQQSVSFGSAPYQSQQHPQLRHANSAPSLDNAGRGRGFKNFSNGQNGGRGFGTENRRQSSSGQYDSWRGHHNNQQRSNQVASFNNKSIRSPLLNPTAEAWRMPGNPPQSLGNVRSQHHMNGQFMNMGSTNMWQAPPSPRQPLANFNTAVRPPPGCWQYSYDKSIPPSNPLHNAWSPSCSTNDLGALALNDSGMMERNSPITFLGVSPSGGSGNSSRSSSVELRSEEGYICQKCETRLADDDAFRCHVEKCFN